MLRRATIKTPSIPLLYPKGQAGPWNFGYKTPPVILPIVRESDGPFQRPTHNFLGEPMLKKQIASLLLLLVTAAAAETIPAGARVSVRLESTINSRTAKTGQTFHGTLARNLVVNGKTVAEAGAPV